jgi:hypothetical protein
MAADDAVSVVCVGDVLIERPEAGAALAGVAPLLERADVSFGNFEGVLTDEHEPVPGAPEATVVARSNAAALEVFDVMSVANNHTMDAGYGGLEDTLEELRARGVATAGAGATLAEALRPAVVERRGVTIAFVAFTSVFRIGAEARAQYPGVAPLRVDDYYADPFPGVHCPGVPPHVVSILNEDDWEAVAAAIAEARSAADVVVASAHWGDHTRPWVVTDSERSCARLLVEAGADAVVGHHHHSLRGVEFVDGKPVFYGLGHLVFDHPRYPDELRRRGFELEQMSRHEFVAAFGEHGMYPRDESPNFPFSSQARHTGAAVLELSRRGLERAAFVPCVIGDGDAPRLVRRPDPEWTAATRSFARCFSAGGLADCRSSSKSRWDGLDVVNLRAAVS